jgi:predicted transglutaminase-like cysteine proteinase
MIWRFAAMLGIAFAAAPALAFPASDQIAKAKAEPRSPDVFGTVALDAGVTAYGARWRRVSTADLADPRVRQIAAATAGLDPLAKLAFIHEAVGRRIAFRSDLDGYHIVDYWAQAGETLDRGAGDSEDIAILKMQALKAAGFAARDLYLSVGRDRLRGADTLLLVRVEDRFYALDDRSDRPLNAREYVRFVPVITLGKDIAWLHGKRHGGRGSRPAARLVAAR